MEGACTASSSGARPPGPAPRVACRYPTPEGRAARRNRSAAFSTTSTRNGHRGTPRRRSKTTRAPARSSAGRTDTDRQPSENRREAPHDRFDEVGKPADERPLGLDRVRDGEASARLHDAEQLERATGRVEQRAQAVGGQRHVEGAVGERQREHVAGAEGRARRQPGRLQAPARDGEHALAHVEERDRAGGAESAARRAARWTRCPRRNRARRRPGARPRPPPVRVHVDRQRAVSRPCSRS